MSTEDPLMMVRFRAERKTGCKKSMTPAPSKPDLKYNSTNCLLYVLIVNLLAPLGF